MYTVGNKVYVRTEIVSVNADDDTKYRVKTNSARFYIKEGEDTIRIDPEQDILTATELYNIIVKLNAMDDTEFQYIFTIYNNTYGTEYSFRNLSEVLASGMDYYTLMTIYKFYLDTVDVQVGDIVRVIFNGTTDSIYGAVLHIDKPENGIDEYTVYDADNDEIYEITRAQAQIIRWTIGDKSTAPIEALVKDIKDIIHNITGGVDRTLDDIPEIIAAAKKAAEDEFNQDEADEMKSELEEKIQEAKNELNEKFVTLRAEIVTTVNEALADVNKWKYLGQSTFAAGINYSSTNYKELMLLFRTDNGGYEFQVMLSREMFNQKSSYKFTGGNRTYEYTVTANANAVTVSASILTWKWTNTSTATPEEQTPDITKVTGNISATAAATAGTILAFYR